MQKKNFFIFTMLSLTFHLSTVYANDSWHNMWPWPALFIWARLLSSDFPVIIAIIIEGLLLHTFIKNISYAKSMSISCIGNIVSLVIGSFCMAMVMFFLHSILNTITGLDIFRLYTLTLYNITASWILMYLGSALIELFVIKEFFGYTVKQLFFPIFIGNLIIYSITILTVISRG